ncbi:unnamed protein product [Tenebrio molitor]|nr:unnamed protein product [Tenebrio molitor]
MYCSGTKIGPDFLNFSTFLSIIAWTSIHMNQFHLPFGGLVLRAKCNNLLHLFVIYTLLD